MYRCIIPIITISFLFSCRNNLHRNIKLHVDDSNFQLTMHVPNNAKYYYASDSTAKRDEMVIGIKDLYSKKGSDVEVVDETAEFTLQLQTCRFTESTSWDYRVNPDNQYDTTWFELHAIEVHLVATLYDTHMHSYVLDEVSSDEESIRDNATIWHNIFAKNQPVTPTLNQMERPGKQEERVIRRVHRHGMAQLKDWVE